MHNFKIGDYIYYFDGVDTFPAIITAVKKWIKIDCNIFDKQLWVSPNSLTLQEEVGLL